jgi:hypothetical protein
LPLAAGLNIAELLHEGEAEEEGAEEGAAQEEEEEEEEEVAAEEAKDTVPPALGTKGGQATSILLLGLVSRGTR